MSSNRFYKKEVAKISSYFCAMSGKQLLRTITGLIFLIGLLNSCTPLNLYERSVTIPQHRWDSQFVPSFKCTIRDTSAAYDIALVLRHRDLYRYNNIWLQFTVIAPDQKVHQFDSELQLGTNETGWLGSGMDDVFEHRISLQKELVKNGISFRQSGQYQFRIKQLMREDPLEYVMNVGIRIEKKR
jgi:gliding motility-associated lipoprotein GldH